MLTNRSSLARGLCALALLSLLAVPAPTHAGDSSGVPLIAGTWAGKVTSNYWDQTNAGSVHPKLHYRGVATLVIMQNVGDDALAVGVTYDPPLPVTSTTTLPVATLSGNVGNYHLGLGNQGMALLIALSGTVNHSGSSITLRGVGTSADYTHEITIKLRKQKQ